MRPKSKSSRTWKRSAAPPNRCNPTEACAVRAYGPGARRAPGRQPSAGIRKQQARCWKSANWAELLEGECRRLPQGRCRTNPISMAKANRPRGLVSTRIWHPSSVAKLLPRFGELLLWRSSHLEARLPLVQAIELRVEDPWAKRESSLGSSQSAGGS